MPKPKRTPREEIERAFHVSFKLPEQAAELLDAYRDQVLTEATELIASLPQDYELDPGRGDARQHLLAARGGQLAAEVVPPAAKCDTPHPVSEHAWCEREPGHDGWHAHQVGTWPHVELPFAARTTQES